VIEEGLQGKAARKVNLRPKKKVRSKKPMDGREGGESHMIRGEASATLQTVRKKA